MVKKLLPWLLICSLCGLIWFCEFHQQDLRQRQATRDAEQELRQQRELQWLVEELERRHGETEWQ